MKIEVGDRVYRKSTYPDGVSGIVVYVYTETEEINGKEFAAKGDVKVLFDGSETISIFKPKELVCPKE